MNRQKWILCAVALALMGCTAGTILRLRGHQRLGAPGVRVEREDAATSKLRVELPERMTGYESTRIEVTRMEIDTLPKDTTFGRCRYRAPDGFEAVVSVVLMGTDRTSIHKPQFCLTGQGWIINQSELKNVAIDQPQPYSLPVMKLTATRQVEIDGQPVTLRGVYAYWFVAENRLTANHWQRMWWMAADLIRTGVLERWAYVTYFAVCPPGQEQATFERLSGLIAATVPKFQLKTGPHDAGTGPARAAAPGAIEK